MRVWGGLRSCPAFYASACKRGASVRTSFGKRSGRTEADDGIDAPARGVAKLDFALVGRNELPDDRQPQTGTALSGAGAPKAIERTLTLVGCDAPVRSGNGHSGIPELAELQLFPPSVLLKIPADVPA